MLSNILENYNGPSYVIDINEFDKRVKLVKSNLSDKVDLVFSIKANPFITKYLNDDIKYIEVCSPGELTICEKSGVDLQKVLFSGVNKTEKDVTRALEDNVGIFTAESRKHVEIISKLAMEQGKRVPLILRLSSGNQFGIDKSELCELIGSRAKYEGVEMIGLHMYTGTAKKKSSQIEKELDELRELISYLSENYDFETKHVEYGPGLNVEYFAQDAHEKDCTLLAEACSLINAFAEEYPITIEMGRFLASECGVFLTKVMDTKTVADINYCICDGGVNHMKYYGQTMAMQIPPMEVFNKVDSLDKDWTICGSLCTTADVIVRKVSLNGLGEGSILAFYKAGAYSICEGIALFLSRELPAVYLIDRTNNIKLLRNIIDVSSFNMEEV